MSQQSICPICGTEVPYGNSTCPVCKADLSKLPQEILLTVQLSQDTSDERTEKTSTASIQEKEKKEGASQANSIPEWMRKRLQNQHAADNQKQQYDFQSYEDILFGNGEYKSQPKSAVPSRPASVNQGKSPIPDAALIIDGEMNVKSVGIPDDTLVDFSVYRPNQKWDINPIGERTSNAGSPSSNNRELFSQVSGNEKVLWEGIDAPLIETGLEDKTPVMIEDDPALAHSVSPGKADLGDINQNHTRGNRKQRTRKPAVHPILPEQAIRKEEQTAKENASNSSAENEELNPESGSLISDLMDRIDQNNASDSEPEHDDLMDMPVFIDVFRSPSVQLAGNKTNNSEITSNSQGISTSNDGEADIPWERFGSAETAVQTIPEQSTAVESVSHGDGPADNTNTGDPGTTFYRQKLKSSDTPEKINSEEEIIIGSEGNSPAEILDQVMQQIGYHKEDSPDTASSNDSAAGTEIEPDPQNEDITVIEEPDSQQDTEIPWDLFGSGDMAMPQVPVDPAYRTFSRSGISTDNSATSYQRKMMSSVLERIIQSENEVPERVPSTARHISVSTRLFWALLAIAGVLFILLSGVTDILIISMPPMTADGQAFVRNLSNVQGEVLVVIDYTPAYGSILDAPLQKLIKKLQENGCNVRTCVINSITMPNAYRQVSISTEKQIEPEWWPAGAISIRAHIEDGDVPENIYLITADASAIQTWGEQLHAANDSHTLHILAPDQLEPIIITWQHAGTVSTAMFSNNDFNVFTEGQHKFGRSELAVWYLTLLLLLALPCGLLVNFIRNDSLSSNEKQLSATVSPAPKEHSDKVKGGVFLEQ